MKTKTKQSKNCEQNRTENKPKEKNTHRQTEKRRERKGERETPLTGSAGEAAKESSAQNTQDRHSNAVRLNL